MSDQLTDEQIKRLRGLVQNNRLREASPDVRFMFLDALDELLQLRQNVYLIADEGGGLVTVERVSDVDVAQRIAGLETEDARLRAEVERLRIPPYMDSSVYYNESEDGA